MNGFVIALICLGVIACVYVILFIVNLIFVYLFLKRIKVHSNALTILLNQKYEILNILYNAILKNDVNLSNLINEYEQFKNIDIYSLNNLTNETCLKNRQLMAFLKQQLIFTVRNNSKLLKNDEINFFIKILNEIDDQFRIISASYNADVIGYNYWIRFAPYVYIFVFNEVDKKDII